MPITKEQRLEYLKKAREVKEAKRKALKEVKEPEPEPEELPEIEIIEPKPRRNMKKSNKTLDLTELPPIKTDNIKVEQSGDLIEEVEEVRKIRKPKRVIKKVIKEEYEDEDTEEEIIEVIQKPPTIQTKHKPKKEQPPKTIQIKDISTTLFNY
jgi:hypothetical protein